MPEEDQPAPNSVDSNVPNQEQKKLSTFGYLCISSLLTIVLVALVYSAAKLVPIDRSQAYSGAILLCVAQLVVFAVIWWRTNRS